MRPVPAGRPWLTRLPVTPSPTASTSPAPSWPGVTSSKPRIVPARNFQSVGLIPARTRRTRTSPGPGSAASRSTSSRTEDGPFSYSGKYYNFNYVNPWPRPYQKPRMPIWVPSQGSGSTIKWAAQHRYTYAQTLSPIAAVAKFFQMYRDEAEKAGYEASPDQLAWSNTIYVAETDEQAMREAKPHLEALVNRLLFMPPEMLLPPGYTNFETMERIRAVKVTGKPQTIEDLVKAGVVIIGSPNTVREKLAEYQDLAGFNTSLTKTQFGTLPDDMTRANMTAIAEEILPHFRNRLPQGRKQAAAE